MAKNTLKFQGVTHGKVSGSLDPRSQNMPKVAPPADTGEPVFDEALMREAVAHTLATTTPMTPELRITCDLALLALKSPCIYKAPLDEPLFVLRAQDNTASLFVRRWLRWAVNTIPNFPQAKVDAANEVALAMDAWSKKKNPN